MKPINERQRLFQFKFDCRPTPKHPSFFDLDQVDMFVWIFDETPELAAQRSLKFMESFPFEFKPDFTADEITDEKAAAGDYPGWQLEQFVKARRLGIHFGFFENKEFF